jgi:hypothetical protein
MNSAMVFSAKPIPQWCFRKWGRQFVLFFTVGGLSLRTKGALCRFVCTRHTLLPPAILGDPPTRVQIYVAALKGPGLYFDSTRVLA